MATERTELMLRLEQLMVEGVSASLAPGTDAAAGKAVIADNLARTGLEMALHAITPFDVHMLGEVGCRIVGLFLTAAPDEASAAWVLEAITAGAWAAYERKKARGFVLGAAWAENPIDQGVGSA